MSNNYDILVGPQLRKQLLYKIQTAAGEDCHVLITGETGTGKEWIARIIHNNSKRKNKNFIVVDFASISDSLFHSELYGHKRGAFTGAVTDRKGLLFEADGGTAFLDEFAELSNQDQAALLRFIETSEIRNLGSDSSKPVDVRLIIATADLQKNLDDGKMRPDIYYRITKSIRIDIPSLRCRLDDVPVLFSHFFGKALSIYGRDMIEIDKNVFEYLSTYSWPGNVRELRNFAEDVARWLDKDRRKLDLNGLLSLKYLNKEKLDILLKCKVVMNSTREICVGRHLQILQYVLDRQISVISVSKYQQYCKDYCHIPISKATALRDLKKLCEIGLIESFGGGRTSEYRILPRQK